MSLLENVLSRFRREDDSTKKADSKDQETFVSKPFQGNVEGFTKTEHMKKLSRLTVKKAKGEAFTPQDLKFLYQVDEPIQTFDDPTKVKYLIETMLEGRSLTRDAAEILGVKAEEVATNVLQIKPNTKVFIGSFSYTPNLFGSLPAGIEHVYAQFPHGKVQIESFQTSGKSGHELSSDLKKSGVDFQLGANQILEKAVANTSEEITFVTMNVRDFASNGYHPDFGDVQRFAQSVGLELCDPTAATEFLMRDEQPLVALHVAMEPKSDNGNLKILSLLPVEPTRPDQKDRMLSAKLMNGRDTFHPNETILFQVKKEKIRE